VKIPKLQHQDIATQEIYQEDTLVMKIAHRSQETALSVMTSVMAKTKVLTIMKDWESNGGEEVVMEEGILQIRSW
jgi:hypothetical protein